MSVQQETPQSSSLQSQHKSIFESTNVKVRKIDLDPKLGRFLKANSEYKRLYKTATTEELKAMPSGVLCCGTRSLYRHISGAGPLDHVQLAHYKQPLLGGESVDSLLREITEDDTEKYSPEIKEYIRINRIQTFEYFPFAFQLAYDLYTTGTISEKTNELKKVIDDRYAEIMAKL